MSIKSTLENLLSKPAMKLAILINALLLAAFFYVFVLALSFLLIFLVGR